LDLTGAATDSGNGRNCPSGPVRQRRPPSPRVEVNQIWCRVGAVFGPSALPCWAVRGRLFAPRAPVWGKRQSVSYRLWAARAVLVELLRESRLTERLN